MPKVIQRAAICIVLLLSNVAFINRVGAQQSLGRIAFISKRDGWPDVYTMNPDGSDIKQITDLNVSTDNPPIWSPDGKSLAVFKETKNQTGNRSLSVYVVNADGSDPRSLISDIGSTPYLSWSPDGKQIAFFKLDQNRGYSPLGYFWWLMIIDVNRETSYPLIDKSFAGIGLAWSPDGASIAYSENEPPSLVNTDSLPQKDVGPVKRLKLVNVKTGSVRTITEGGLNLQWSPDGKYVATIIQKNNINNLYAINITSGQSRRLTGIDTSSFQYSPDGKRIAFSGIRKAVVNLYVVDADGRNQVELTRRTRRDLGPSWSPDSKQIVFWSDLGIAFDLFSIDVSTKTLRKLTSDDGTEQNERSVWQPTLRLLTQNTLAEAGRS